MRRADIHHCWRIKTMLKKTKSYTMWMLKKKKKGRRRELTRLPLLIVPWEYWMVVGTAPDFCFLPLAFSIAISYAWNIYFPLIVCVTTLHPSMLTFINLLYKSHHLPQPEKFIIIFLYPKNHMHFSTVVFIIAFSVTNVPSNSLLEFMGYILFNSVFSIKRSWKYFLEYMIYDMMSVASFCH